jgi:hypothetical protein
MNRWIVAALAAATLISATAIAETLAQPSTGNHEIATRWSTEDSVPDYVPSVNFAFEGQAAFVLP